VQIPVLPRVEIEGCYGLNGYEMRSDRMIRVKSGSGSHRCDIHNGYGSMRENWCYFPFSPTR